MAIARMAVSLPCHGATEGQDTLWLGVAAFGRVAESLTLHKKADMLSVSGAMRITHWPGQYGVQQTGYQIVVDAVSAKTVQPRGTVNTTRNNDNQPQYRGRNIPARLQWLMQHGTGKFTRLGPMVTLLTSADPLMKHNCQEYP